MNEDLYYEILKKIDNFETTCDRRPTMLFVDAKTLLRMYSPGQSPFATELCRYGSVSGLFVYEARDRFRKGKHPTILEVA